MIPYNQKNLGPAISFGPFRLLPAQQVLLEHGRPVRIGSRALALLAALAERPGELVTKDELICRAWPNIHVEEVNLRVQLRALRQALGQAELYIATIPGLGYRFVAPVSIAPSPALDTDVDPDHSNGVQAANHTGLPTRLRSMIGRDLAVREICDKLSNRRFVSLVGPGGIGKTTVAVGVAHELLSRVAQDVRFMDLASIRDQLLVPNHIAAAVGVTIHTSNATETLVTFLRDKQMLLVLDSCEHVIDVTARVAERISAEAPHVSILVTSREPLRVEGEHIYRLLPLATPPESGEIDAQVALTFPAVQLFIERAAASGVQLDLTDAEAPAVAQLCRTLDGIPLAIELAAGRVHAFGVRELAMMLDSRLLQLTGARRTAVRRHQTLSAMLDWSHDLLQEQERVLSRRLSIFVGPFGLDAASAIAAFAGLEHVDALEGLASLVSKSLVSADVEGSRPRYRLLETTRSYLRAMLLESGENEIVAARHARFYCHLFSGSVGISDTEAANTPGHHNDHLGNARAALEWCFGPSGDPLIGTHLAAAAASVFLGMSLLCECRSWCERAIAALENDLKGTCHEIRLQRALGHSLMFTEGNSERALFALNRGLVLSRQLSEPLFELQVLSSLQIFYQRSGNYFRSMEFSQQSFVVAEKLGDPAALAAAHSMLGLSNHLLGNHPAARTHLDSALANTAVSKRVTTQFFGFDYQNRAQLTLAFNLWLQGKPDEAARAAQRTTESAKQLGDPVTLCLALSWSIAIDLWNGDLARAESQLSTFVAHAAQHSLEPYAAVAQGRRGQVQIRLGEVNKGVQSLQEALASLQRARFEGLTTIFKIELAAGLACMERYSEALTLVERTICETRPNGDLLYMPELLRVKGEALAVAPGTEALEVEACFVTALEWATRQSALAWQLRAATSLARFLHGRDRSGEAHNLLEHTYSKFTEGFDTADMRTAKHLLHGLSAEFDRASGDA